MSHEKSDQRNKKIVELVKQVKTLTQIVNKLQVEVDSLKSRVYNKNNSNSEESKTVEANGSKLNRFRRLNIFRKDNETAERRSATKNVFSKSMQTIDKEDTQSNEHTENMLISHKEQTTNQTSIREPPFKNKSRSREHSTRSVPVPEEVEFLCIVETCPASDENNLEDSRNSRESTEIDIRSTCKECDKRKTQKTKRDKIKLNKFITSKCSKDCPYLIRDNTTKEKNAAAKNFYEDKAYTSKKKQCKNKKTMVNFVKNDKRKSRKFINSNENFSTNCKRFESSSYINEGKDNHPEPTKIQLLDHDRKCIKVREIYCKRCFKKRKTKVLNKQGNIDFK